jgi:hypothetical protein
MITSVENRRIILTMLLKCCHLVNTRQVVNAHLLTERTKTFFFFFFFFFFFLLKSVKLHIFKKKKKIILKPEEEALGAKIWLSLRNIEKRSLKRTYGISSI